MVWYSHLFKNFPEFVVVPTVKGFGVVNKAEVDVFLELFCFFNDPTDVGNLISGSSAFSKSSLNIWKFMVHILLNIHSHTVEHTRPGASCDSELLIAKFRLKLKKVGKTSDFPSGSDSKAAVYNAGDPGSIPGSGRSTGEGNGNPLQYYCLENPMDRGVL